MILLGLTGSVASSIGVKIARGLHTIDPEVSVVLTEKAKHFIHIKELTDIGCKVYVEDDEWQWEHGIQTSSRWKKNDPILHILLRDNASKLVIAPCSANTMGKIANGLCDNLLTSIVRAWDVTKPVFIAPAMNTKMWQHPVTHTHLSALYNFGYEVIRPQSKELACGEFGMGALADIDLITNMIKFGRWKFPLMQGEARGIPIYPHPGAYGYPRKGSKHTGIDLYTTNGALVRPVEDGVVVCVEHFTGEWDNSPWWNNTDCILVEGNSGVVCYGEITTNLKVGDKVNCGYPIANVVQVIKDGREHPEIPGHSKSMLHLELYPHGIRHPSEGFEGHLRDPTPFILNSKDRPSNELVYDKYKP